MASSQKNYYKELAQKCEENNQIPADLYKKLDVKRGLRNQDGTGVLAGLTQVSSVIGSKKTEKGMEPVDGVLRYRGIDSIDLVEGIQKAKQRFGFEEVVYLLLFGKLPNSKEFKEFLQVYSAARELPPEFVEKVILPYQSKDIMNNLSRCTLALYGLDENGDDTSTENLIRQAIEIVSKFSVYTAYAHFSLKHHFKGEKLFIQKPRKDLSTAENFLYMIRPDGKFTELEASVLDVLLIIHADHGGGNNSTFTTRVVSSSRTDSYSAIAAAVGSLKGPLHGGANISVRTMIEDIQANAGNLKDNQALEKYLIKILDKKAGDKSGKIYGFGHAVYTKSDPRAVVIKGFAERLAVQKGREEELDLYLRLEKIVPDIFNKFKGSDKVISPNVDFFSGFVYDCLGIPKDVYTPLFATGRVAGWMAHRIEELMTSNRIIRPGYKAISEEKKYLPEAER